VLTHAQRTTDRTTNLLISSSVHYVHLGGDNYISLGFGENVKNEMMKFMYHNLSLKCEWCIYEHI